MDETQRLTAEAYSLMMEAMKRRSPSPLRILGWGCLTDVNHAGEAVVTFHLEYAGSRRCTALVFVNPRALSIQRVSVLAAGENLGAAPIDTLPGILVDLAVTRVQEVFPVGVV